MEKKQNVPALRFQGFSGEWKEKKIEDMAGIAYGGGTPSTQYAAFWQGTIPWIQSSDVIEDDFWDISPRKYISKEAVKYSAAKVIPKNSIAIIIRVGVGKLAFLPFDYATSQDFLSLSRLKIDERFGTYAIWKGINADAGLVQGTSIKGIEREEVLAKIIKVPVAENEAKQVGNFFYHFDQKIRETKRKIQKLQQFRQAMLAKLFPREGAAEPELRFRGFSGKWKSCCLTDIATINPPGELPETFNYVDLESVIGTEIVKYRRETKFSAPSRAQRVAEDNDVFYQMVRPYQKNNCIFRGNDKTFVFSTGYAQLRPNCNSYFLLSLLQTEYFVGKVMELCTGTSFPAISASDLARIPIYVPVMSEENGAIGEYFQNLDSYISLQQKKLERMQRLKAALLEKLFV